MVHHTLPGSVLLLLVLTATAAAQSNDSCSTALAISGSGTFTFDSSAATTSGNPDCAGSQTFHDLWYEWTAPATGEVRFETCASSTSFETRLVVYNYTSSCSSLAVLACSPPVCGSQSRVSFVAIAGETYLLRLGSTAAGQGGPGEFFLGALGAGYCGAVPNSTGVPARLTATGSASAAANDLTLRTADLPSGSFAFYLASTTQAHVPMPGGSSGDLCLGGSIGRYVGPGQIQQAGAGGTIELALDVTRIPQPTGFVAAQAGETWSFQTWYRDVGPSGPTSNFSNGRAIQFQ